MIKIGLSILRSTVLPPAVTRRWMKPDTFVSAMTIAVGKPWEIRRVQDATNNRVTDYYTKEGELGSYSSLMVLSPDHQIGIVVNTADDRPTSPDALHTVTNALLGELVPAVEQAARSQAARIFGGTYTDKSTNSSILISTDSHPGMKLGNLVIRGENILAELAMLQSEKQAPSVRLYPTGLKSTTAKAKGNGTYVSRMGFKAAYEYLPIAAPQLRAFAENCQTWFVVDSLRYGLVGLDELLFGLGKNGDVQSVQVRALGVVMTKNT
ncbi:hypothetical protein MMC25_001801 [Agyrium rufum]|nr:hypothetical protein [Agyrium rufum]